MKWPIRWQNFGAFHFRHSCSVIFLISPSSQAKFFLLVVYQRDVYAQYLQQSAYLLHKPGRGVSFQACIGKHRKTNCAFLLSKRCQESVPGMTTTCQSSTWLTAEICMWLLFPSHLLCHSVFPSIPIFDHRIGLCPFSSVACPAPANIFSYHIGLLISNMHYILFSEQLPCRCPVDALKDALKES